MSVDVLLDDLQYVESMMRADGSGTFNTLLMDALRCYGRHLDCGVPTHAFDLIYRRKIRR